MTRLPKHLRPRWRYLAVEVESWPDASIDRTRFQTAVSEAVQSLLGDVRSARADISVYTFRFDDGRGAAVVRVRRDAVDPVRAALACLDTVDGQPVGLRIRGVSGTVRGCEENYLGNRREPTTQSQVAFADAERPAFTSGSEVDVRVDDAFVGAASLDLE